MQSLQVNCCLTIIAIMLWLQGFTASQAQAVEDNTALVIEREKEIKQIVRSIHDLNEIFKDLASMIVDQVNVHFVFINIIGQHFNKAVFPSAVQLFCN